MTKSVNLSMQELSPLIIELLNQGKEVILTVTGNSMRPFLRGNRDQIILTRANKKNLNIGDVPLYIRENGCYVLHRIVGKENGSYTMLGDAQVVLEKGITNDQIIAVASGFIRKGKRYDCNSKAYKRYISFWQKILPLRRLYSFVKRALRKVKAVFRKLNNALFHKKKSI